LNNQNREREIKALLEVKNKFGINDLKIITYNTLENIEGVSVEPIWRLVMGF
jgi:hypothetical protein